MKKYVSLAVTILGAAALVYCIVQSVDGIGRAALIAIGLVGTFVGWSLKPRSK